MSVESNFPLFVIWLKSIETENSFSRLVEKWMQEATRVTGFKQCVFLKYIHSKKSLVLSQSVGIDKKLVGEIGIDLAATEPGFTPEMLSDPDRIFALQEFIESGLKVKQASWYTLKTGQTVHGVFAVLNSDHQQASQEVIENSYLHVCLHALKRQIVYLELSEKLSKYSIFDHESEVLNRQISLKKLKEEVSRSRRIAKPVALLFLTIDNFHNFALTYPQEKIHHFVRNFAELLVDSSRMTDLVGRVDLDQFIICLPHTGKKGAAIKAERLRRLIETADFSPLFGDLAPVTVSIGVSEYPSLSYDSESLFNSAERAFLQIKKTTKNKILLASVSEQFVPDFIVDEKKNVSRDVR